MTKQIIILVLIVAAVVGFGVILFKTGNSQPVVSPGTLVRSSSNMTGNQNAKVTLVEFGDYQCPFCAKLNPIITQLLDNYKGNSDFNFVFRNFPLQQHQFAQMAAESAEAAGAQGKFWEMQDKIYKNQNEWAGSAQPLDLFASFAQSLGLDVNRFKQEVQNNQYKNKINEDTVDGNTLGVNSTPTLYLNGKKTNSMDYVSLKNEIDNALKQ